MATYRTLINRTDHLRNPGVPIVPEHVALCGHGPTLNEAAVAATLADVMGSWQGSRDRSDAAVALALHRTLEITRRDAADARLWELLHVSVAWPYVRWRWGNESGRVDHRRLSGSSLKGALPKLWWAVEMLGGDPDLVERLLEEPGRAQELLFRVRLLRRPHMAAALVTLPDELTRRPGQPHVGAWAAAARATLGVRSTSALGREGVEARLRALGEELL